jgi:hypothetical protein
MFQLPSDLRARIWKTARFLTASDTLRVFLPHKAPAVRYKQYELLIIEDVFVCFRIAREKFLTITLMISRRRDGRVYDYQSIVDVHVLDQWVVVCLHVVPVEFVQLTYSCTRCYRCIKSSHNLHYTICEPFWTFWGGSVPDYMSEMLRS